MTTRKSLSARPWSYGVLPLLLLALAGCTTQHAERQTPGPAALSDYATNMASCLRSAGWEVQTRPDGGITSQIPAAQADAYAADRAECEKHFGYDATPEPLTDAQIKDLYRKVLETLDCLKDQGRDPGVPPTEQPFIDQAHGTGAWDPYTNLYRPGKMTDQEYFSLLAVCPRTW